jgi:hypothetical protein
MRVALFAFVYIFFVFHIPFIKISTIFNTSNLDEKLSLVVATKCYIGTWKS